MTDPRYRPLAVAAAVLLLASALLAAATPTGAAGFGILREVTTLQDRLDPNDGVLSLREAIALSSSGDGIGFAVTGTITLTLGELVVQRGISIDGPGARKLTIDGNNTGRVFMLSTREPVYISNVTITRGFTQGGDGSDQQFGAGIGGAIYNFASLTLYQCAVTNSLARGGSGSARPYGGQGIGGAIYNDGALVMSNCVVNGNRSIGGMGSQNRGFAFGGGIYNELDSQLHMINTTVADNSAESAGGAGGGLLAKDPIRIVSCTFSGNRFIGSGSGGGIFVNVTNALRLHHTVVAGNTALNGPDVSGYPVSEGYNFIGIRDGSRVPESDQSPWTATDRTGTAAAPRNARLGPLRNNGGPIDTMALAAGSLAVDMGGPSVLGPDGATPVATDARGLPRRIGVQVDAGAYERDLPQTGTSFVVTTLDDSEEEFPGVNHCSLRSALRASNAADTASRISFKPGLAGVIEVGFPLYVSRPVTIVGPGARVLAVSGGGRTTVLDNSADPVSISRLTLRDGLPDLGGGVGEPPDANGGGIINSGRLTLRFCAVLNNQVRGASTTAGQAGKGRGGGIYNTGVVVLGDSTLALNAAWGGEGTPGASSFGGLAAGGALYNGGTAVLTNCTLWNNVVLGGSGGDPNGGAHGQGGAIFNAGSLSMLNCSLVRNTAWGGFSANNQLVPGQGGGLWLTEPTAPATVRNTLFALNRADQGPEVYGIPRSDGTNLAGAVDPHSSWKPTDKTGTAAAPLDARLGSFGNQQGQTDTVPLLSGSPAIDGANPNTAPASDQREFLRSGAPDIGAFEFGGQPALPPVNSTISPSDLSSKPGGTRTLTSIHTDPNGVRELASVSVLINDTAQVANALCVSYDAVKNKLYLRNQANTAWLGGYAPGAANTINDPAGQGSLNCAATRVSWSGDALSVTWSITPNQRLAGNQNLYLFASDRTGRTDGWDRKGTWSLMAAPTNLSVSPNPLTSPAGVARTLTTTFEDANGAGDFREAYLLVNTSTAGGGAIYGFYNAADNKLYLRSSANDAWLGGHAPGSDNVINDPAGRGSLDCSASRVVKRGNTLIIHWRLIPARGYTGSRTVYLLCRDASTLRDGWDSLGSWTITP